MVFEQSTHKHKNTCLFTEMGTMCTTKNTDIEAQKCASTNTCTDVHMQNYLFNGMWKCVNSNAQMHTVYGRQTHRRITWTEIGGHMLTGTQHCNTETGTYSQTHKYTHTHRCIYTNRHHSECSEDHRCKMTARQRPLTVAPHTFQETSMFICSISIFFLFHLHECVCVYIMSFCCE